MRILTVILTTLAIFIALLPHYVCAAGGASGGGDQGGAESTYFTYLLTNQFIYELTRRDGTSPVAPVIRGWMEKIGKQLGIVMRYSERLSRVLVIRANNIRRKVQRCTGSIPRQKFLQLKWELQLLPIEVEVPTRESKIEELELHVSALAEKNIAIEKEIESLQSDKQKLLKKTNALSDRLKKATSSPQYSGRNRSSKPIEEYSESHRRRLKRARTQNCETSLSWLENDGFIAIGVQVKCLESGKVETVPLQQADSVSLFGPSDGISEDSVDTINMILFVKDWYNISGDAYHELASICKELPRHYKIKQRIAELNRRWNIKPTPFGTIGLQQSLEERLHIRLAHLLEGDTPHSELIRDKVLHVKLSGDGTNIGKRLHVINFTFTVLEEGSLAHSCQGNHILAVLKEPEKYDTLKNGLADIRAEVEHLTDIEHNGMRFKIVYYLGGDLKFLAIITGVDCASCKYACIWCKVKNDERYDADRRWSMSETSLGARTIEENIRLSQLPKSRKEYNVSNTPLFPTIPLTKVVIDNLHLFLRVADVLIDLLIIELRFHDCVDKVKKFTNFDCTKYKHIHGYEQFICGLAIPGFQFYIGQSSKALKCRSLTGPEKLRVFQSIDIQKLLPLANSDQCGRIQHLWSELYSLNKILSKPKNELPETAINEYEERARQWGRDFVAVYQSDRVTPYIHAMMNHVHEFMRVHGSILPFTQQGLEKLNHNVTKNYFRSSCHRGEAALQQLIEKQNRLEHLSDIGAKRKKSFEMTCSNCEQRGHNRLTCTEACSACGYESYHQHLVVMPDQKKVPSCQKEN